MDIKKTIAALEKIGLTNMNHLAVFNYIAEHENTKLTPIMEDLKISRTALVCAMYRLEKGNIDKRVQGLELVVRKPLEDQSRNDEYRRNWNIKLTAKGERVYKKLKAL